jgi:hypothetical protein
MRKVAENQMDRARNEQTSAEQSLESARKEVLKLRRELKAVAPQPVETSKFGVVHWIECDRARNLYRPDGLGRWVGLKRLFDRLPAGKYMIVADGEIVETITRH